MSTDLVRRVKESAGISPGGPNARVSRQVIRAIENEAHLGLVAQAKVQKIGLVAHGALTQVAILSAEEELLSEQHPYAAPRLRAIVDIATAAMTGEVAQLG